MLPFFPGIYPSKMKFNHSVLSSDGGRLSKVKVKVSFIVNSATCTVHTVMSENVQDCVLLDAVMLCTASDRLWCL